MKDVYAKYRLLAVGRWADGLYMVMPVSEQARFYSPPQK